LVVEEFEKLAKQYAEKSKEDHQLLLEAHLAATVDLTFNHFRALWHSICKINKQAKQFRAWAIKSFPQSAQSLRSDEPGVIVKSIGDALILYKCREVSTYTIKWNRKHAGKCWFHFPVYLPNSNVTKFLRVEDRRLLSSTKKIACTERPRHTVVVLEHGGSYYIDHRGRIEKFRSLNGRVKFDSMIKPPRGFNTKIRFKNKEVYDSPSLLQMIAESEHTIEELMTLHSGSSASTSLIEGIGRGLGAALEAAGGAGDKVIHSLGRALKDAFSGAGEAGDHLVRALGDSSSKVLESGGKAVKDSATGISYIFKEIFGGIPGIIIWTILLPLAFYVIYLKISGRLGDCACRPRIQTENEDKRSLEGHSDRNEPDDPESLVNSIAERWMDNETFPRRPLEECYRGSKEHIRRRRQVNRGRLVDTLPKLN